MKKTLQDLTIRDDFLFGAVMAEEENCRRLLECVTGFSVERVEVSRERSFVYHPEYKGIRLDVFVKDENNTRYNVEMQVVRKDALEKRARYYRSQMDMDLILRGQEYENLPDTYVIFICDFDFFGLNLPMYHTTTRLEEDINKVVDTGEYNVILNSRATDFSTVSIEVKAFLEYVRDNKVTDDFTRSLKWKGLYSVYQLL